MDELLGEVLAETEENLERLDAELLRFEREPNDRELLDKIFRLFHTIKGTCGFFNLNRLSALAHAAETRLGQYREGEPVTVEGVSVILSSLDRIKEILRGLEEGAEPEGDDSDLIARLEALGTGKVPDQEQQRGSETPELQGQRATPPPPASPPPATPPSTTAPPSGPGDADAPRTADDSARRFFNADPSGGETGAGAPAAAEPPAGETAEVSELPPEQAPRADGDGNRELIEMIRVRVDTLEKLMTTVSELVLTRNQLVDVARRIEAPELNGPLHRLTNVTNELQRGIMKARMLPIAKAWQKLPRLVRELSLALDKPIKLVSEGGEVELDRQVLEFIRDPLTHLIRNAADHGIETREARRAAGKPEQGRIRLRASAEGGHIVIEIADDGRGLDARAIYDKCVDQGIATPAELDRLSEADIQQFVFRPGFSTARQITDLSGRGVGLDVVRSDVELIGGTVELKSSGPRGSVFAMRIPLTLAIAPALIVEAGGLRFALPQHNLIEVVRPQGDTDAKLEIVSNVAQLGLRGKVIPVFDLAVLLGERRADLRCRAPVEGESTAIAVLELGSRSFGLMVDDVVRTEEIVVKPKSRLLRNLSVFSGNTILGDGSVIMIVDPTALAHLAGLNEIPSDQAVEPEEAESAQVEEKHALLLVRAGSNLRKAVPLSLVTRLEEIPVSELEACNGGYLMRYRGRLIPVLFMEGVEKRDGDALQPILLFDEDGRQVGLAVDAILDVVEEAVSLEIRSDAPGVIGVALVREEVVEVVDVSRYLGEGHKHLAPTRGMASGRVPKVLLVDDSIFFRNLLAPLLTVSGYDVTLAGSAHEALELREEGKQFDIIISDLEMPDLDGIGLAEKVKSDRRWGEIPMMALCSHSTPQIIARARAAGYTDCLGKFDRQKLVDALQACCSGWEVAA